MRFIAAAVVICSVAAGVGAMLGSIEASAASRRLWTSECYQSIPAAVARLNELSEEQQLNASFVTTAYDGAHNPYCLVFTR